VKLGALRGTPDSCVLETVSFDPKLRTFGNRVDGEFIILTTGINPPYITSSLLHVDFGVYCLHRKSTLKRRLSG
jgi:hypothetical protein